MTFDLYLIWAEILQNHARSGDSQRRAFTRILLDESSIHPCVSATFTFFTGSGQAQ